MRVAGTSAALAVNFFNFLCRHMFGRQVFEMKSIGLLTSFRFPIVALQILRCVRVSSVLECSHFVRWFK